MGVNMLAAIILIIVHLLISFLYLWLVNAEFLKSPGGMFWTVLFVPVFGFFCAVVVEWTLRRNQDGMKNINVDKLSLGEGIYSRINVDSNEKPDVVVPLEEAILIDDTKLRRTLMIDILHKNHSEYVDLFKVARLNSDVEVTHYAVTAMMEIQREHELEVQRWATEFKSSPEDLEVLENYVSALSQYIKSGLLEGHLLYQKRVLYSQILDEKRKLCPYNKQCMLEILDNYIELFEYTQAEQIFEDMTGRWPEDEIIWFDGLKLYMTMGDRESFFKLISKMNSTSIKWTAQGKEKFRFWNEVNV